MRLIDADALIDRIMLEECNPHDATYYADLVDKFPTVDVVLVEGHRGVREVHKDE